jgi:hypothetical protein
MKRWLALSVLAVLFVLDVVVPDPLPLLDEIALGFAIYKAYKSAVGSAAKVVRK